MSLRAVWVLAPGSDDWTVVFERRFQAVEQRARDVLKAGYVEVPHNKKLLARSVAEELGLWKATKDKFQEERDACKKRLHLPALKVNVGGRALWPIVAIEHLQHLLVALTLIDKPEADTVFEQPSVSTAYNVLLGMQQFLGTLSDPGPKAFAELHKYIGKVLPFGRPAETNASTVRQALLCKPVVVSTAVRLASQKPYITSRNKPTLRLVEMVRAGIYGKKDFEDSINVYGTILWTGDIDTGAIKLNLFSRGTNIDFVSVHPCVSDLDRDSKNSVKLRFAPVSNSLELCRYTVDSDKRFPLGGSFELRCSSTTATFTIQLRLGEAIKKNFDSLEVHVSFPQFVSTFSQSACSCGEPSFVKKQQLIWKIDQNLVNWFALFEGTVKFAKPITDTAAKAFEANAYAAIVFSIGSYAFSGLDITATSVQPTLKKLAVTCEKEFKSSDYVLWNVQGEAPVGFREVRTFDAQHILQQDT